MTQKQTEAKILYNQKTTRIFMVNYWIRPNKIENIHDTRWNTKNTKKIQVSDKVIFYISGVKKLAGIATMGEDRQFHFDTPLDETNFVDMPSEEFLRELDYVNEMISDFLDKRWLGLIVQSTYKISEQDYNKIRTYILENMI